MRVPCSKRRFTQGLSALLLSATVGCLSGGDADPLDQLTNPPPGTDGPVQILMTANRAFASSDVTVDPGQAIAFVNEASVYHTLTPEGHTEFPRREFVLAGERFDLTINTSGTYQYFCEPHQAQGMTGVIRVR
jgi:plastocyanin